MAGVLNYLFLDSFELNLDFHSFHPHTQFGIFISEIDERISSFFVRCPPLSAVNIRPLYGTACLSPSEIFAWLPMFELSIIVFFKYIKLNI